MVQLMQFFTTQYISTTSHQIHDLSLILGLPKLVE